MSYVPFKQRVAQGMSPALAAYVGRKKYGKAIFDELAAAGKTLRGVPPKRRKVRRKH